MKTIREILKEYLEQNGYDGFYLKRPYLKNCHCEISDNFPCNMEGIEGCKPGIKIYSEGELGWTMMPKAIPEKIDCDPPPEEEIWMDDFEEERAPDPEWKKCSACGAPMCFQTGSCYTCSICGETSGCG